MQQENGARNQMCGRGALSQEVSVCCYFARTGSSNFCVTVESFHPQIPKVWVMESLYQNAQGLVQQARPCTDLLSGS